MNSAIRLGYYASILTVALTVVTFGIAVLTPPLSGPLCVAPTCFDYPFIDIDARFPRDYIWMYPAIALFSSAVLIIDYFLQVSVIPSSLVNGEMEGIAVITIDWLTLILAGILLSVVFKRAQGKS